MTSQACILRIKVWAQKQPVGPHLTSGLQGVNLAPVWGVGVKGGLGTSSKLPGSWEQWGHCGRSGVSADCWHSQPIPQAGPHPRLPAATLLLCSLPQVLTVAELSSQPPHLACLA